MVTRSAEGPGPYETTALIQGESMAGAARGIDEGPAEQAGARTLVAGRIRGPTFLVAHRTPPGGSLTGTSLAHGIQEKRRARNQSLLVVYETGMSALLVAEMLIWRATPFSDRESGASEL